MGYLVAPFSPLLSSNAIILICFSLQGTLIPLRGGVENFSDTLLGIIGAAYYAGFILGSIHCPKVVQRAGHIRSFAVFASLASITPLLHGMFPNEYVWIPLRSLSGYCYAGLILVIESWLNEQVDSSNRGRLFAIYLFVNLLSITLAQLTLNLAAPTTITLFVLTSIMASLALLPVSLTKTMQPAPIQRTKLDLKALWGMSPVGLAGCFIVGVSNGPLWTLAPAFAQGAGFGVREVSFFMTAIILGGAALQWPIGRLSDLTDRRWVVILVNMGACVSGLVLVWVATLDSFLGLLGIATVLGAFTLNLYGICVALTNDNAPKGEFVMVAGGLLFTYSIGAFAGPVIVSGAMLYLGTDAIFLFTATIQGAFILFVLARIFVEPAMPVTERSAFAPMSVSQTAPKPLELDPRVDVEKE